MTNRDNESDRYGNQGYGNQGYGNQGYGGDRYGQEWRNTGNYRYGEGPFGNWGPGYYGYGQGNQGYGYGNPSYGYQGAAYTGNYGTYGYPGGMYNPGGWNQYGTRYGQGMHTGNNQQWHERGPFSGVGPQNYQRSDQRIMEDVNDRLTEHPNLDARNINVDVHNGEVTLNGWVDSRQDKRTAEDIADSVTGVKNVSNNLSVQPSHQQQPGWMQSVQNAFTPGSTPSSTQQQGQQGQYGQQTTQTGTRR